MIRTRICEILEIEHPIALGGMGSATVPKLVAAVSNGGGLGTQGCYRLSGEEVHEWTADIREHTERPFGLNFLLFLIREDNFTAALEEAPPVMVFAWTRPEQDLKHYFDRAHEAGCKVMFMGSEVEETRRAAEAGADVIVAQGTEGGGHVKWMGMSVLVPMVVDAVAPVPVMAAGGIADGRGMAAALALGAEGVLLGTRFLATNESPLHQNFKQAIVDSDGHDTVLTEIPDITLEQVWPGGMSRARRNRFIERWAGREWALRQNQSEAKQNLLDAREKGDIEEGALSYGQDAGLIGDIPSAGEIVRRIAAEAEEILSSKLPGLVAK